MELVELYFLLAVTVTICYSKQHIPGCPALRGFEVVDFDKLPPCFCDDNDGSLEVVCIFNSVQNDVKNALERVKSAGHEMVNLISIKETNWQMKNSSISKEMFVGLKVKQLQLANCGSNELVFNSNALSSLELKYFATYNCKLKTEGEKNDVRSLPSFIKNMLNLEELRIERGQLENIPPNFFKNAENLKAISFPGNVFGEFDANALVGLKNLEILEIEGNGKLKNDMFNAVNKVTSLRLLTVRNASIPTLTKDFLKDLINLEQLQITSSQIAKVESNAFSSQQALQKLNLKSNKIDEIEKNAFLGLSNLTELILSNNSLKQISNGSFYGLESVVVLSLENSQIDNILTDTFTGLAGLQVLEMKNNQHLSQIQVGAFRGPESLTRLLLPGATNLKNINIGVFDTLDGLRVLDLSGSELESIEPEALAPLENLEQLMLNSTSLTTLVNGSFTSFQYSMTYLDLSNNRWHCDDNLIWLSDWINQLHGQRQNNEEVETGDTACATPHKYANKSILTLSRPNTAKTGS